MKKNKLFFSLLLVFISLIPLRTFFNLGLPKTHDIENQLARFANFNKSFDEGVLFPRWGSNLSGNLGNPTLMFLYPLPNYLNMILNKLGFSLIESSKILFCFAYIFSGIFMFLFLSEFFRLEASFLGALLYLFSPYRFVDLYVRGALPEHLFFMFAPLSLLFLWFFYLKKNQLFLIISSLFLASLILIHNACSLIFFPFSFLLAFFLFDLRQKMKFLPKLFILSLPFLISIILSFFYWFPALTEGKYTLRHLVINKKSVILHLSDFKRLIIPDWGYNDASLTGGLSPQVGIVNLFVFLLLTLFLLKRKIKINHLLLYLYLVFLSTVFLISNLSVKIWQSDNFLYLIRFPWRLLVIIVFIFPFFGALLTSFLIKESRYFEKNRYLFLLLISFISVASTFNYQKAIGFFNKPNDFFLNEYKGTADNGECSPLWSTLTPNEKKTEIEVIEGKIKIINIDKKSERHIFDVVVLDKKARIADNTLYFPGWSVYDNGKDITHFIEFQDPSFRGLITFWLEKGYHHLEVIFKPTKIRKYSEYISFFGLLLLLFPLDRLRIKTYET